MRLAGVVVLIPVLGGRPPVSSDHATSSAPASGLNRPVALVLPSVTRWKRNVTSPLPTTRTPSGQISTPIKIADAHRLANEVTRVSLREYGAVAVRRCAWSPPEPAPAAYINNSSPCGAGA